MDKQAYMKMMLLGMAKEASKYSGNRRFLNMPKATRDSTIKVLKNYKLNMPNDPLATRKPGALQQEVRQIKEALKGAPQGFPTFWDVINSAKAREKNVRFDSTRVADTARNLARKVVEKNILQYPTNPELQYPPVPQLQYPPVPYQKGTVQIRKPKAGSGAQQQTVRDRINSAQNNTKAQNNTQAQTAKRRLSPKGLALLTGIGGAGAGAFGGSLIGHSTGQASGKQQANQEWQNSSSFWINFLNWLNQFFGGSGSYGYNPNINKKGK